MRSLLLNFRLRSRRLSHLMRTVIVVALSAAVGFFCLTLRAAPAQQPNADTKKRPLLQTAEATAPTSSMTVYSLRLRPGQDLKKELTAFTRQHNIEAGVILTCVGSLTQTALRYANKEETTQKQGHFEIVSLVGTLDSTGGHLHLSVSDGEGRTAGGHLKEGNIVYTTAEIAIGSLPEVRYTREKDSTFGYDELVIRKRR